MPSSASVTNVSRTPWPPDEGVIQIWNTKAHCGLLGRNPFVKDAGCNKITCTRCGTLNCYVCRQTVKDYSHFNDKNRGGRTGQCPLFDESVEQRHQVEAQNAEEAARNKVIRERPNVVIPP